MKSLKKYIGIAVAMTALTACTGDYEQPPVPVPPGGLESIGTGAWDKPMSVYQVSLGAVNEELPEAPWVSGYIVGYVNVDISSALNASTATFTVPATVATNLLMASTPDCTDWTKCITVQLPSGGVRNALNLKDHPENLHAFVTIQGTTGSKYCSVYGVRSVQAYTWDKVGIEPAAPVEPVGPATFRKVSEVTSGKEYLIVAGDGKMALPLDRNYGYLQVEDVKIINDEISLREADSYFTLTATEGGYRLIQPDGRYVFMTGTYNSFNAGSDASEPGAVFSIEAQADGKFKIVNVSVGKTIQYDATYNSYGAYSDMRGVLPSLYEKVE